MMMRLRKGCEAVIECIETVALCVVIGIALALGWAERASASAWGDEPSEDQKDPTSTKRNSP